MKSLEERYHHVSQNYTRLLFALAIDNIKKLDCPDCLGNGKGQLTESDYKHDRVCYACGGTGEIVISSLADALKEQTA